MNNRDRISYLSLSFLCSITVFAGDTPQIPNYVTMVNKDPANPPQMPQINPQYPQNAPPSNGVGSSALGGALGLLVDVMSMREPDISKEKWLAQRNEAIFQADLAKHGASDAMRQFYPERFVDKNPVYGFQGLQNAVVMPEPIFAPAPAPVVAPEPVYTGTPTPLLVPDDMVMKAAVAAVTPSPIPAIKDALNGNGPGGGAETGAAGAIATTIMAAEIASVPAGAGAGGGTIVGGWGLLGTVGTVAYNLCGVGLFVGVGYMMYQGIANAQKALDEGRKLNPNWEYSQIPINEGGGGNPQAPKDPKDPKEPKERKFNSAQKTDAMRKLKENYKFDHQSRKYKLRHMKNPVTCTRTGKQVEAVDWDGAHGDIEAYRDTGHHMGSLDPKTFEMYKGPVAGRKVRL